MTDLNVRGDKYRVTENDAEPAAPIIGEGGDGSSKCKMHFERYYKNKKLKQEQAGTPDIHPGK